MAHSHQHEHQHLHLDPSAGDRRVSLAIWANGLLTLAQVLGGILSGSLALIADALHNLSDMAALIIAFAARKIARRPADTRMTFGYGRVEVVAALINYTTLILLSLYLLYEGVLRWIDPSPVAGWAVVIIGCIALAVDAFTAALTWAMQRGNVNIRALFLHNLSDAFASVAVVAGGTLILLYDLYWVDPVITLGIAVYILYLAAREIGDPVRTLMLGSPVGINGDDIIERLLGIDGVEELHHVHLWQMQENQPALDTHVVLSKTGWPAIEQIKAQIKSRLAEEFGIEHSTLEFEHADHSVCHDDACGHGLPG